MSEMENETSVLSGSELELDGLLLVRDEVGDGG